MERLARFSVSLPAGLLKKFDHWIEKRGHKTRSDALRQLIRYYIAESFWEEGDQEVYGALTLTYDHHSHDAAREVTAIQHDFGDIIICSTHIHVDHNHCFEVVVLRGEASKVKNFLNAVSGLKSVHNSNPVFTAPL